ncbi:MAG: DNA cytosine methyltransferase [Gammaproteobacteria bacterium]|nr:DNA cytosine methyltransferase [Gammaproteobacteria bacterium]
MLNINSYFSGAGLFDIGLMQAGLNIQQSFELDAIACKVQRDNFGTKTKPVDISKKLVRDDAEADWMVFTYPCTKYSPIADIHNTRTGDELFLHALRHIAIGNPEGFTIENVPGMKAFPVVMEAMTKLPNYYITTFCPIESDIWLPQKRDRLIIMASKKPFNWRPPVSRKAKKLIDILEHEPRITIPKYVASRMNGAYRDLPIISDPHNNDIAPLCVAHYAKDKSTRLVKDKRYPLGVRPYSVREYARLQGVPDSFTFNCSDSAAYRMIGNGVPIPAGEWVGKEINRYFEKGTQQ